MKTSEEKRDPQQPQEPESNQYYLEKAPLARAVAHLSIPMMLGMSVGTVYNVVNAYFIGMLHNTAMMSAITLGLPIFTVLMAAGNVFGVGAGTFITRLVGGGTPEKGKKVAGYAFYGSLIAGLLIALVSFLFIVPLVNSLGADASTHDYTKIYAMTLIGGGFTVVMNFALEQLVRSEGASKQSMYGIFISTGLSLILDPLLILGLDMHVMGAALAMILANAGSALYYVYFLQKKSEHLRGFVRYIRLSLRDQWEVYKIGVSELFKSAFMIVTTLLFNHFMIEYGSNVLAGAGIGLRIVQIPEFLAMGLFIGMIPFFAFNFARPNIPRFKAGFNASVGVIGAVSFVFVGLVYVLRDPVMRLFSNDPAVLEAGTYILGAMLVSALFNGFTGLFLTLFQAAGEGMPTMVLSVTQGVLYIPTIIVLHAMYGLHGVIWSMTVTEVITCVLGLILYIPFRRKLAQREESGQEIPMVQPS